MDDVSQEFSPSQVIGGKRGEWEIAVARHSEAPTFTFDLTVPSVQVTRGVSGQRAYICNNMTRADLEQHVARCQAALAWEA